MRKDEAYLIWQQFGPLGNNGQQQDIDKDPKKHNTDITLLLIKTSDVKFR
jgi:hypothetical protein